MISEIIQSNQDKLLLLTGDMILCPEYMIRMLQNCVIDCFMPVKHSNSDELIFDTLNGTSLSAYLQKKGYTPDILKKLLYSIKDMMCITSSYLLDAEYVVLDVRYIYVYKNETFKYILNPFNKYDLNNSLKQLVCEITAGKYTNKNIKEALYDDEFSINHIIKAADDEDNKVEDSTFEEPKKAILKNIIDTDDCITITKKDIIVGKVKLICDFKLSGKLVSARHACMRYSHDTVYVRDLNSRNGTYINGERIKPESFTKIKRGDIVAFGDNEYILM